MKETASVFCVDLGYRLRSWKRVPLQGSRGWLTSRAVLVPVIHVIHVPGYLVVGPGSAPGVW